MKRCLLLLTFFPLFVVAQKKLTIRGQVTGLEENTIVSLTDINKATDTIARAHAKNGAFEMTAVLEEPMLINLGFGSTQRTTLFLDNSKVKVSGNVSDLRKLKIRGSHSQTVFGIFQEKFNPLFQKLGERNRELQMRRTDSAQQLVASARKEIQDEIDRFVKKYRSSPVSSFLLAATIQLTEDIFVTERRFEKLKASATNNVYGNYLRETIAETKVNAIGSIVTDFTQADTLGNPVSLSSFRGKYVLLDFWASWCGPCRVENPNVVQNFNKFKDKNFTVLGVSLDRPGQKEKWLKAIHDDQLTWTHVSDLQFWNNAVAQQFGIQSIPQNFLIDPNGKIVAKNLRGEDLENKLCELLGCD